MSTDLPIDIFEQISASLSHKDLIQCSITSRAWNAGFSRVIHRIVRVKSRKSLQLFFRQLQQWQKTSQLNKTIRELSIGDLVDGVTPGLMAGRCNIGLSPEQFHQLPTLCPLLEKLDFHPRVWKHIGYNENMRQWRNMKQVPAFNNMNAFGLCTSIFGSNLTHLTLRGPPVEIIQSKRAWRAVLLEMPMLTHLTLFGKIELAFRAKMFRSYLNLKEIHETCIHLKSLHLTHINLDNAPATTSSTRHHTLQELVMKRVSAGDPQWLRYITMTFPQLETLDMDIIWVTNTYIINEACRQEFYEAYDSIGHCRQLRKLYLRQVREVLFPDTFFDLMKNQLAELHVIFTHDYLDLTQCWKSETVLQSMLQAMRSDATSFGFKTWYRLNNIDKVTTPLKRACQHLTSLELEGQTLTHLLPDQVIVLSTILNNLPKLKCLTLRHFRLRSQSNNGTFPLISITLSRCVFTGSLFETFAIGCPDLKNIALANCTFINDSYPTAMVVTMEEHNLDTFSAVDIHASLSPELRRVLISTAFFGIERSVDREKVVKRKQKRHHRRKDVPAEWKHKFIRFYHMHQDVTTGEKRLRRLRLREAETLVCYQRDIMGSNKNPYLNAYDSLDEDDEDNEREDYNSMGEWRQDLPYGYLFLRCRSIRKVLFANTGKLEFNDW